MKRLLRGPILALLAVAVCLTLAPTRARADDFPSPGFALVSSGGASINNLTTAVPFTIAQAAHLSIQCPRAFYYATGKTSTTAAVNTGDFYVAADVIFDQDMNGGRPVFAMLPKDGAAMTCYVKFRVR